MNKKIIKSIVTCLILTVSFLTIFPISQADGSGPHSMKGTLYINDEIPASPPYDFEQIIIKIVFTEETYNDTIYEYNQYLDDTNYNMGLWGHEGETADIFIEYYGQEITPDDNQTITINSGEIGFIMDLHITTEIITPNNPPNTPANPKPENNSENIGLTPQLSVFVTDPDGDALNVSFYNASNDALIGVAHNVQNATNATVNWIDLEFNTSYNWYAVANDSEFETYSDTFTFKTIKEDNIKPAVSFEKPEEGSLYLFNHRIFSGILKIPFILGKINIVINATDNQSGISKVELSIKGVFREINENLTEYPYSYEWSGFFFGKYNITATAYDMNGNSANTSMIVRKFL